MRRRTLGIGAEGILGRALRPRCARCVQNVRRPTHGKGAIALEFVLSQAAQTTVEGAGLPIGCCDLIGDHVLAAHRADVETQVDMVGDVGERRQVHVCAGVRVTRHTAGTIGHARNIEATGIAVNVSRATALGNPHLIDAAPWSVVEEVEAPCCASIQKGDPGGVRIRLAPHGELEGEQRVGFLAGGLAEIDSRLSIQGLGEVLCNRAHSEAPERAIVGGAIA